MYSILSLFESYYIDYEKTDERTFRVYGSFDGFSVVRTACVGWVEVDGRLMDMEDFEDWLSKINI